MDFLLLGIIIVCVMIEAIKQAMIFYIFFGIIDWSISRKVNMKENNRWAIVYFACLVCIYTTQTFYTFKDSLFI